MTTPEDFSPERRASVLIETLPYIQRFAGATIVVKFGGNAMVNQELAQQFAKDIVLMQSVGIRPVVVHGGAPQITDMLNRLGMEPQFVEGLRVTDADTLDVARMVLVGKVNRDIVSSINVHGPLAVGLSGEDAGMITATARNQDLGFVGDVAQVNPAIVNGLLSEGLIPVISSIGADKNGQAYNINADTVAAALAGALGAERILYLTDIEGLRTDIDDPASHISRLDVAALQNLMDDGTISGGMIPKAEACLNAVNAGVGSAHMVDGRLPHVLLLELFTDSGIGTMVFPVGGGPDAEKN
ncbi:MAG: acetylglutamate kinase [Acidimicrobiales bacterium]|nr:acetylglutamate kinase [Acidimicrobiales bacterium]